MIVKSNSRQGRWRRPWLVVISMAFAGLLLLTVVGCVHSKPAVIVIKGNEGIVPLKQGEAAPFDGWLLGDATFHLLYEQALEAFELEE